MTIMEELTQESMDLQTQDEPLVKIVELLTENKEICFKSQQRGETDLTKSEKHTIAVELFNKSKLNFLLKFGKYLPQHHLMYFQQFRNGHDDSHEIESVLRDLLAGFKKRGLQVNVKNRRYEALKEMIRQDCYFSEIEMMKRNPLLYEELVGQYLTEEEKTARDRIDVNPETTLVKVLLEGIDREAAKEKRKEQENCEEMDVETKNDSDSDTEPPQTYSRWGEFSEDTKQKIETKKERSRRKHISTQEQELLREEFTSSMYQSFLDGEDEDFDYATVDSNAKYDSSELIEEDEEDKYFESEEPETLKSEEDTLESSEDELDIYMSGLNQNPVVAQLSTDIQRM